MSNHGNEIRHAAARFGGTVDNEDSGRWCTRQVNAPPGKSWACSGIHTLCVTWRRDDPKYREESITDALERIQEGVEDCDEPDCEVCESIRSATDET